jgi:hypothetical protein
MPQGGGGGAVKVGSEEQGETNQVAQVLPEEEGPMSFTPSELDDVLSTDFGADFDLSQELWQYC